MTDTERQFEELNHMAKAVGVDACFHRFMPIFEYNQGIQALLLAIPAYVDKVVERKIMELERV